MKKTILCIAAAALFGSASARAQAATDPATPTTDQDRVREHLHDGSQAGMADQDRARERMHQALSEQAPVGMAAATMPAMAAQNMADAQQRREQVATQAAERQAIRQRMQAGATHTMDGTTGHHGGMSGTGGSGECTGAAEQERMRQMGGGGMMSGGTGGTGGMMNGGGTGGTTGGTGGMTGGTGGTTGGTSGSMMK